MNAPEKIEVNQKSSMILTWAEGPPVRLDARTLRAACPCADCRSPVGDRRRQEVLKGPKPITIVGAELRGAYAINLIFGPDQHGTGIFTWDLLSHLSDPAA